MKDPLTPEDKALWQLYGEGVERLKKTKAADCVLPPPSALPSLKNKPSFVNYTEPITKARAPSYKLTPLESRQLKKITIEASLDLHGHKLDQAEIVLHKFVMTCQQLSRRWVLVITGKGLHSTEKQGTLKRFVQEWFSQNTHLVIGFTEAKPYHGGAGAFYVKVRRLRGG